LDVKEWGRNGKNCERINETENQQEEDRWTKGIKKGRQT
jgi:hypothetical protein